LRFKYTSKQVPLLSVSTQTYGEGKVKVISSKRKEEFPSESRPKSLFPTIDYTLNISTTPLTSIFTIFYICTTPSRRHETRGKFRNRRARGTTRVSWEYGAVKKCL